MFDVKVVNPLKVVEIKEGAKLPPTTPELKESLAALSFSPAFQYILSKLAFERASLRKYLEEGFTLPIDSVRHLQGGIHYLGFIEAELKRLTRTPQATPRDPLQQEAEAFEKINSTLERVG